MEGEELRDIIKGCAKWHIDSQEKLYRSYSKLLYKTCLLYAKDKDEASDFLHDSFLQIFKSISSFKNQGSFVSWMKKVCVNICLQELKLQKRMKEVPIQANLSELGFEEQIEILEELNGESKFNKVLQEINKLPTKAALVIKLYVFEGWTHQQIAEELQITVGTSKSQLNYARNLIKERCYEE